MFESDFDKRPLFAGRELERASLFAQADQSIQCELYPRAETTLYRVDTLCGRILCDRLFSEQFLSLLCEETACNSRQPSDDLVFDAIYTVSTGLCERFSIEVFQVILWAHPNPKGL